jgi:L-asparaginase II
VVIGQKAVAKFPDLISNRGGVDCEIIRLCAGRVLAKIGAEALFCIAVQPCDRWPHGLGIALKIEDGTGVRARAPGAIEILRQLNVLDATDAADLRNAFPSEVRNRVGTVVGKMIATVELNFMA